jgi:hypothetical protein
MDDLKTRIEALLGEGEFRQLKQTWIKHLTEAGIEEREAGQWVTEIDHVLDAYETSLRYLVDLFQENDQGRILRETESWVALTLDITIFKIEDAMRRLQKQVSRYLPPEPDDEDEPS